MVSRHDLQSCLSHWTPGTLSSQMGQNQSSWYFHKRKVIWYSLRALTPVTSIGQPSQLFVGYFIVKLSKKVTFAPDNNRGMTYQTDEKHLTSFTLYFVGGGLTSMLFIWTLIYYYVSFANYHLKYLLNQLIQNSWNVTFYKLLVHPGLLHTIHSCPSFQILSIYPSWRFIATTNVWQIYFFLLPLVR